MFLHKFARRRRARFLGMVTGQDSDLLTQLVAPHRLSVSATAVGASRHTPSVDVEDGAVAQRDQMVHREARASFVGHPDDVDPVFCTTPRNVHDGHLFGDGC